MFGFTGTRKGMSAEQKRVVDRMLEGVEVGIHGDCIGADADFHEIAMKRDLTVHLLPCTLSQQRAYCSGHSVAQPRPPLERNRAIVDSSEVVIACPKGAEESRSGTWATIRYAKKVGKSLYIVWPDGTHDVV